MKKYILTFLAAIAIGFANQLQAQVKPVLPINPTIPDIWTNILPRVDTAVLAGTSFSIGTKIYIVTGDTSNFLTLPKHHNRLWQYDTVTKLWSRKADFPGRPRIGAASFTIGNKAFVGGGRKIWHPMDTMYVLKKISFPQDTIVVHKDFMKTNTLWKPTFSYTNPYTNTSNYQKIDSFVNLYDSVYQVRDNVSGKVFFVNLWDYQANKFSPSFYANHTVLFREEFTHSVYRGDSVLNDFWMYDPAADKWTQKASIPGTRMGRAHPVGFSIKNKGYIGLGYDNDSIKFVSHVINRRVDKWLDSIEVNLVSVGPPAVYKIDTFYRFDTVIVSRTTTFRDSIRMMGDLWEYDTTLNSWKRRPDFPGKRRSHAIGLPIDSLNNPGFGAIVGLGRDSLPNVYYDTFFLYKPADSSWRTLTVFPSSNRYAAAGFSLGFLGYIVCGSDGLPRRDFFEYNMLSNTWDRLADYPITDSTRFLTIHGRVGNMGYVGTGGDNKDLHKDWKKWIIDTSRVYLGSRSLSSGIQPFNEICAGAQFFVTIKKPLGYTTSTILTPELSDTAGSFFTPKVFKNFSVTNVSPDSVTIRVTLPDTLRSSQKYKYRVNSLNPKITGQPLSDSIRIRSLQFITIEPRTDSSCLTAPAFFSVKVDIDTFQKDTVIYQWRRNGVALSNSSKYSGVDKDTLFIDNSQSADQGQYDVIISGRCGRTDTSKAANFVVENISPPTITLQPVGDSVCQTSTKTFTIDATGTKPYFRWLKKRNIGNAYDTLYNNPFILGATSKSLTITPTRLTDSGWYRAEVFEECGARVKSDSFKLDFFRVASILKQPINVDTVEFVNVGFKVVTSGYKLTYQWYQGTTPLVNGSKYQGVDTDSLTIINARMSDVGFYNCVVTGACGTPVTSLMGLLELDPMPVITQQPDSVTECSGSTIFFSVKVDGANIKYQWRKDNVPLTNGPRITGADERTLVITDIIPGDNGDYDCEVSTGPFTKVISNKGRLKVKSVPGKPAITKFGAQFIQADISCTNPVYRWYLDNIYEPTLNQQTVQPKKVGDYRVRVTCDGCISELSEPFFWFPTNVDEVNSGNVKLYPNPATKEVDVEIPSNFAAGTIRIHDMLGKLVATKTFEAGTEYLKLNISTLSKGMYFVSIESEGNQFVGKLIKE